MTQDEYQAARAAIIKQHGAGEYDDREPLNESARLLLKLRSQYALDCRAAKRAHRPRTTEQIVDQAIAQAGKGTESWPELFTQSADLEGFTETERRIIELYLQNLKQTPKQIAAKLQISHQLVTAALNTQAFKFLFNRLARENLVPEAFLSVRASLRKGDTRASVAILQDQRIIGDEDSDRSDLFRIQDPEAEALLKQLGDELATRRA